ncbi:hypothetical protein Y032_0060g3132 [Ancylostoma ceylanicum]|nr:hypothetical protein Y032_0060g3132 [Ancylostoma ceylanicum]
MLSRQPIAKLVHATPPVGGYRHLHFLRSCPALVLHFSRTMPDIVVLNVGGKKFSTTAETLRSTKAGDHTYFTNLDCSQGEIFIDRDPTVFKYILNYLREGRVIIPGDMFTRELIMEDAKFYGLKKFARMLEWAMGLQGYQVIDVKEPICPPHYLAQA